jgi:Fur family transcriptional regulator, ferric uptake regulator
MSEYKRIVQILRQHGERITIQRHLVIQALIDTHAHMTVSGISEHIQTRHNVHDLAEPTIYRILQWLKELKLVSQTDMAASGIVYQIIGSEHHHHLVCLNCARTVDLADTIFDDIRTQLVSEQGFHARIDHMAIYGYCSDCRLQPD